MILILMWGDMSIYLPFKFYLHCPSPQCPHHATLSLTLLCIYTDTIKRTSDPYTAEVVAGPIQQLAANLVMTSDKLVPFCSISRKRLIMFHMNTYSIKLNIMVFMGRLEMIGSFLHNRTQNVSVNGTL